MAILGEDNRSLVTNFNIDGIDAVVAIDSPIPTGDPRTRNFIQVVTNTGTGNLISPYHILTAGHVIFGDPGVKVRLGAEVTALFYRTRSQHQLHSSYLLHNENIRENY